MNEAKRVSEMTDQEVIAELRKWEAARDRLQRRLFARVIWTATLICTALGAIAVTMIATLVTH